MKALILSALWLLLQASAFCQSDTTNFGFERTMKGGLLPDDWFQWGTGYVLKIDTTVKSKGKNSVVIQPLGEKLPNTFGCVAYAIPARYQGKEIELRARMKFSDVSLGNIGLMLRIDGSSGILGFENMYKKNIQGTKEWSTYSVNIPYPTGAKTIFIGAILGGTGKLWVDDFEVLLDGKDIREAEVLPEKKYKANADTEFDKGSGIQKFTLTETNVRDLAILCKVWGFFKYYHPAVASGDYNWDYELFRIVPKILNSKDQTERNALLNKWCQSLGEFEKVKNEDPKQNVKIQPDLSWIEKKTLGQELTSSLNAVKAAKRSGEHFYIALAEGVGNPIFNNEKPYYSMNYTDVGIRLLSLFRYWNIINYYFPYKNLITENWNAVLKQNISAFVEAEDELSYKLTVLGLIADVHDTHANIWGMDDVLDGYKGRNYPPVEISFVEGKAVVTGYFDKPLGEKSGLKVGDIIETIEGKPVDDIIKGRLPLTPASNYPTQLRDIAANLLRSNKSLLEITYSNGRETLKKQLDVYSTNQVNIYARFQRPDSSFRFINSDIACIYPGTLTNAALPKIMEFVSKTKGLIIDFRCYPKDFTVFALSAYLLPEEKSFVKFTNGSLNTPGLFSFVDGPKVGGANPDYYKGKVVIIINETTQSSAEYHTMAFRVAPRATVIGSTTAAADGNVSRIHLPGNIMTSISGIGVYYPDGTETQRIGIVPDVEMKPTIKGIRAGRDELLEKAIELIYSDK
ncbi:MAG TPA: S41 family peptidase [Chryseolinea sp.]|nr:S41 family peptidase [Chryseolinea sp.]